MSIWLFVTLAIVATTLTVSDAVDCRRYAFAKMCRGINIKRDDPANNGDQQLQQQPQAFAPEGEGLHEMITIVQLQNEVDALKEMVAGLTKKVEDCRCNQQQNTA